ncbi:MAG: DnaA/Hda family protein [Deltaproteobacteria bacterium]
MTQQLTFDLPAKTALGRSDFFVSAANEVAVQALEHWQGWPSGKLLIAGPEGSGKSHLAQVWADLAGATLLDDIKGLVDGHVAIDGLEHIAGDPAREEALFHLHNHVLAAGNRLLITSRCEPARLDFTLPDLQSRMLGTQLIKLDAPDETLLTAVMAKLFDDRQVNISPAVISYATTRLDRTFAAVHALVAKLDALSLERAKPISRQMVAEILETTEEPSDELS